MIKLVNLSKSYNQKIVLNNLDITFPSTGLIGISGKSGSGKSTLLNLLAGLDRPSEGTILIKNLDLFSLPENEQSYYRRLYLGFIFQDYQLITSSTVYDNIKMGLTFAGLDDDNTHDKIMAIAEKLNIADLLNSYPIKLSGGEQQRVAIARALVKNPYIILADEPTGSIDEEQAKELMDILKEISKTRLVIMVSHDQSLLDAYADALYVLKDSQLHTTQTPKTTPFENLNLTKTNISPKTLFKYAFKNLLIHRLRTLILMFILIISIVGIASSYHFDYALNNYITTNEQKLVDVFPLEIDTLSLSLTPLHPSSDFPKYPSYQYVLPANIQNEYIYINQLDANFYDYLSLLDASHIEQMTYIYDVTFNYARNINNQLSWLNLKIDPLTKSEFQLSKEFDVIYQNENPASDIAVTLIIDNYNRIPFNILQRLNIPINEPVSFDTLSNTIFYYFENNDLYDEVNDDAFTKKDFNELDIVSAKTVSINRIIRQMDGYDYFSLNPGLYITNQTYLELFENNLNSNVTQAQLMLDYSVLTGNPFNEDNTKDGTLKELGYLSYPTSYRISAKNYTAKLAILAYIKDYPNNTIIPLDKAQMGIEFAQNAFSFFSLLGFGFIMISLISSISMIGLTTYTSIIERASEIGILKTLGADKKDINKTFFFELVVIALVSVILSFVAIVIAIPVLNLIMHNALNIRGAFSIDYIFTSLFLLSSILFIIFIGLVPVTIYNKKQAIDSIKHKI